MQTFKEFNFLYLLLSFMLLFASSTALQTPTIHCGNIQLQRPFLGQNSTKSFPLNRMIRCKSQKLYFRTSLGLFPISSIDYTSKTLTVSHSSCSSSEQYVSPALLSAGFPSLPQPNSLLLFNCSHKRHPTSSFIRNCTRVHLCGAAYQVQEQEIQVPYSCLLVQDVEKLDAQFHPKDLRCSGYRRVYRRSLSEEDYEGVDLGTRISFDIPDHVPDICNECKKPHGNCGVGLKCICHAKQCKDKVLSAARSVNTAIHCSYGQQCAFDIGTQIKNNPAIAHQHIKALISIHGKGKPFVSKRSAFMLWHQNSAAKQRGSVGVAVTMLLDFAIALGLGQPF